MPQVLGILIPTPLFLHASSIGYLDNEQWSGHCPLAMCLLLSFACGRMMLCGRPLLLWLPVALWSVEVITVLTAYARRAHLLHVQWLDATEVHLSV